MDYSAGYLEEVGKFSDLVLAADPDTEVPTCPGWTLKQLLRHTGGGNRWAAQMVTDRMDTVLNPAETRDGQAPADLDAARRWLRDGAQLLLDGVAAVGPDTPIWTFTGPQPSSWWIRRRMHEVAVHRADAAIAVGVQFELAVDKAADALSEWLDLALPRAPLPDGRLVHLHAHDPGLGTDGEWLIRGDTYTHEHGKGDVAVRGSVLGLLLVITRRRAVADADVEVLGDADLLSAWLETMKF